MLEKCRLLIILAFIIHTWLLFLLYTVSSYEKYKQKVLIQLWSQARNKMFFGKKKKETTTRLVWTKLAKVNTALALVALIIRKRQLWMKSKGQHLWPEKSIYYNKLCKSLAVVEKYVLLRKSFEVDIVLQNFALYSVVFLLLYIFNNLWTN